MQFVIHQWNGFIACLKKMIFYKRYFHNFRINCRPEILKYHTGTGVHIHNLNIINLQQKKRSAHDLYSEFRSNSVRVSS